MKVPAPDPAMIRQASLEELERMGIPLPSENFPLIWEAGDEVELRPIEEIEARVAILVVIMERVFGMPGDLAVKWLLDADLIDHLTPTEWRFIAGAGGNPDEFSRHMDALFAFAWLLGFADHLDPGMQAPEGLPRHFPQLRENESYAAWRSKHLPMPRPPEEAAVLLDLYYCLDRVNYEALREGLPPPGPVKPHQIVQRRWALEWAVLFSGPFHEPAPRWEDVDLSV